MNPLDQQNTSTVSHKRRLRYRHFFSYSGLALTSFYLVLAISAVILDQRDFSEDCFVCFNGVLTGVMVTPATLFARLVGMKGGFDVRDWSQVAPYIGFTTILVYFLGTGLEKLSCYLINCFRHVKPDINRSE